MTSGMCAARSVPAENLESPSVAGGRRVSGVRSRWLRGSRGRATADRHHGVPAVKSPRSVRLLLIVPLVSWSAWATSARADWPATGAPITRVQYDVQYPFTMASDGAGGAYFSWASITDIASRLTSEGVPAAGWGDGGLRFGGPTSHNIRNVADGAGGCYFVFNSKDCVAHCGADPSQRRVLRLGPDGTPSGSWLAQGVAIADLWGPVGVGGGDAGQTDAVADGKGGLLVGWGQHVWGRRDPVELRVQRMNALGARLWGDSGLVVQPPSTVFPRVALAPDRRGGTIAAWTDERPPFLYAQRVTPTGGLGWDSAGVPLADEPIACLSPPLAVPDGSGGAIFAWFGAVGADSGIFAVRVNARGHLPWRRPLRVMCAASGIDGIQLVPARGGELIVVWRDAREPGNETVHAQRISHCGRLEWARGLTVCGARGHKDYVAATTDDRGGAYVAWGDTRPAGEVYATHLDRHGRRLRGWDLDGTPICPPVAAVWQVALANDGEGNAVLAWTDERLQTTGHPYRVTQATRLLPFGPVTRLGDIPGRLPGERAPRLAGVGGVPARFALHGTHPNPGRTGALVRFSLPDASRATLALYDLAGRRLWSRDVGVLGAGEQRVRLADGAWLPPGAYFARLTGDSEVATVRVTILR